jgi:hypothetical protein
MKGLLKLSLTALVVFVLTGCGGGGGGGGNSNGGGGSGGDGGILPGGDGHIADFMSYFPSFDPLGYTLNSESKIAEYRNAFYSSSELAKTFNATISGGDFTLYESEGFYNNDNYFRYVYRLNNPPASNGLYYSGTINIESHYGYYGSQITMFITAEGRSIPNREFADVFGEIDAGLLTQATISATYYGDMSAKFAAYYEDVRQGGKFFDESNPDVDCDITYETVYGHTMWYCFKYEGAIEYYFALTSDSAGTYSIVHFDKNIGY